MEGENTSPMSGPHSQPMGAPGGPPVAVAAPPPPKRSLKWLWIALAVVVVLGVLGGGGAYALSLYAAPGAAATQFCGDLKAQDDDAAYNLLSAKLQTAYSRAEFKQASAQLDAAEGKVTACGSSGSYDYSFGASKATVGATLTRGTQGSLQGGVHLVNEGGWKVDALDTSLLGVNLGALGTLGAFCTALQGQNYSAAYDLLSTSLQAQAPQAQFVAFGALQDLVDGKVTACGLKSVASGNTDASTTVTVTVTRATKGAGTGDVSLEAAGGAWKISKIDQAVQGTNLGPLVAGTTFTLFITAGDLPDAYKLTSAGFQQAHTQAQLAALFAPPAGAKWLIFAPDMTTYTVSGTTARYSGQFEYLDATGAPKGVPFTFGFAQNGAAWQVDTVTRAG